MAEQPPLAQYYQPWFADNLCRDHAQNTCFRCLNIYGSPAPRNTNHMPHPAPDVARRNLQAAIEPWRGPYSPANSEPDLDVWVRWSGESAYIRLTDPDLRLLDVMHHYNARGLRVECFDRWGALYWVHEVPLETTLGDLVNVLGDDIFLIMLPMASR